MTHVKRDARTFGERVREYRLRRGLTLREAAGLAGLSAAFWSDVENDKRRPSASRIDALANALGVSRGVLRAHAVFTCPHCAEMRAAHG